ncbi:MAG: helix-turn-helix transcriptional regulator [Pseudomonadales bacterium]|nr:helix-turn-helix transcriptional regulator [Pseudomonadales bacterium]
MAQTSAIVDALKQALKEQNITYQKIANHLELSEASVKRLFSEKQFSLKRLDQICELMGIEISDLMRRLDQQQRISHLELEQERRLVTDIKLLIVAVSCLNRWSFSDIFNTYDFSPPELIGKLTKLDSMGLIELLPNNKMKPLITHDFAWIKRGPIQKFFESNVQQDYLQCQFDQPGELRLFITGMLSPHANQTIQQKMKRLAQEFRHHHQEDLSLPLKNRHGMSMLVAIRPWELQVFEEFRRADAAKHYEQ